MEKSFTKSKVMRMDWEKGQLVEINDVTLEIGQRVYGVLGYGGSESGTFYCISEPDENGNQKHDWVFVVRDHTYISVTVT